mmetsp:Transcript_1646/g.4061  ORF Transcript_1646/g.4061 Transcript_1646/m.4061 type:complete len:251 (-) Transcript_1646:701-1453(-)|eukprot:455665-Pelagomonas_calceolata.AAC.3
MSICRSTNHSITIPHTLTPCTQPPFFLYTYTPKSSCAPKQDTHALTAFVTCTRSRTSPVDAPWWHSHAQRTKQARLQGLLARVSKALQAWPQSHVKRRCTSANSLVGAGREGSPSHLGAAATTAASTSNAPYKCCCFPVLTRMRGRPAGTSGVPGSCTGGGACCTAGSRSSAAQLRQRHAAYTHTPLQQPCTRAFLLPGPSALKHMHSCGSHAQRSQEQHASLLQHSFAHVPQLRSTWWACDERASELEQ